MLEALGGLALLIMAVLGGVAAHFRGKANTARLERDREHERAEQAEAAADVHRRVDQARSDVAERHREEAVKTREEVAAGRRDHLTEGW